MTWLAKSEWSYLRVLHAGPLELGSMQSWSANRRAKGIFIRCRYTHQPALKTKYRECIHPLLASCLAGVTTHWLGTRQTLTPPNAHFVTILFLSTVFVYWIHDNRGAIQKKIYLQTHCISTMEVWMSKQNLHLTAPKNYKASGTPVQKSIQHTGIRLIALVWTHE